MLNENNEHECKCGGNCECHEDKDEYVTRLLNTIASLSSELDIANAEIKRLNGIIHNSK